MQWRKMQWKKRRKHKRTKEQNPELLPHKTIPNQPYSPSGSWSSPWRSWWSAWAKARAYLCSGSWEGSSYTRLPHLASPPFAALLTTVLKHCSPLHTTVLKHWTAFSYILSIQDVGTANLAVLEEPELRAEQCKKSLLAAISVWK